MVAATMVGLALLTVLSLLWMARRVHERGQFGPKASAMLRSLYPIVLGLGGWFLGALIVMATMPGVRLDHQLLVALSTGLPIGLGIYFAWVHPDWPTSTRTAGFAVATAGSLVGACLGSYATAGLIAPITAVVGATAGANLTLLALEVWRDKHARDHFVDSSAKATSEALTAPR